MKRPTLIVLAAVMVLAALVFLAGRTNVPQEVLPPQVTSNTVSWNDAPPSRNDTVLSRAPSTPPVSGAAPSNTAEPSASPFPPNKPVVVGSKTFIPKAPPPTAEPGAAVELDKVRLMLRDYRTLYHENPVGTNAEIMKTLMGGNPKQARLGPPEGQTLSAAGELLDRWGTPYFFHQLSSDLTEVRSAGPDKTMWTSDDIVTK